MKRTVYARVHRFHEWVALHLSGDGIQRDLAYLSPDTARQLSAALARYADSCDEERFSLSQLGTWLSFEDDES